MVVEFVSFSQYDSKHYCLAFRKRKKTENDDDVGLDQVRIGISFVINFIPNSDCNDRIIFDLLHTLGLNVMVKPIFSVKGVERAEMLTSEIGIALKDHNSRYAEEIVQKSLNHCRQVGALDASLEDTPCIFSIVNKDLENLLTVTTHNLSSDGLKFRVHIMQNEEHLLDPLPYRSVAPKGIEKALDIVREFMNANDYKLNNGYVFSKPDKATFTYTSYFTVHEFVNRLLGNRNLTTHLLPFVDKVIKVLSDPSCDFIRQVEVDYDLIEINNGLGWSITQIVVKLYENAERTPRAFCPFDACHNPDGGHFKTSVVNSFPDPAVRANFLTKWYQLLLHGRFLHKTRKLMVCGPKDSGKSTWVLPIMSIIPKGSIASLTKEKQFSCSMLTEEIQLCFVDEFTEDILTADQAKAVLQGGFMPVSMKHKTARTVEYNSPFFITAQKAPNWGEEDENVKRRLAIFFTKPLNQTRPEVAEWLSANAMHCIVWAAAAIKSALTSVDDSELFFLPEKATFAERKKVKDALTKHQHRIRQGTLEVKIFDCTNEMLHNHSPTEHQEGDNEIAGPSFITDTSLNDSTEIPATSTPKDAAKISNIDFNIISDDEEYMKEVNKELLVMRTDAVSSDCLVHLRPKRYLKLNSNC